MSMSLKEQLLIDMKEAIKKDALRKISIQSVRGSFLKREKDTQSEATEEDIIDILV